MPSVLLRTDLLPQVVELNALLDRFVLQLKEDGEEGEGRKKKVRTIGQIRIDRLELNH